MNPYKLDESILKSVHPGSGPALHPQSVSKAPFLISNNFSRPQQYPRPPRSMSRRSRGKGAQYIVNAFVFVHGLDIVDLRDRPIITYHSRKRVYSALVRDFKCGEILKDSQCLTPKDAASSKIVNHELLLLEARPSLGLSVPQSPRNINTRISGEESECCPAFRVGRGHRRINTGVRHEPQPRHLST